MGQLHPTKSASIPIGTARPAYGTMPEGSKKTDGHFLTERQQELICRMWKKKFASYELGCKIYEAVFERAPDARPLFAAAKYGDRWKESDEFRVQSLRFVEVLSFAVEHLRSVERRLNPMLRDVGFRHKKLLASGFGPELWDVFRDAIHQVVVDQMMEGSELSDADKETLIDGWRLLASHIIEQIRVGFNFKTKANIEDEPEPF